MGKARRRKQERRSGSQDQLRKQGKHLLMTLTNEPFQPVRLYYSIPSRARVINQLAALECMLQAHEENCWQWLYHAEAAALRFSGGYEDVPEASRPIILGRIRFPADNSMTLQTNSVARAIGAANFFAPRLGPECVAIRLRVVNRLFAAEEGRPDELARSLDRDITVTDPRVAEAAFDRDFQNVRTMEDAERAAAKSLERRLQSKEDVPLVEDFPLAPEEETPDFRHLTFTLHLRLIRAMEHWRGNVDLTLTALIMRIVDQPAGG